MKANFGGFSAVSGRGLILALGLHAAAWSAVPERALVSATIDGAPWRAEHAQVISLAIAGKPQLNFAATRQSGGIQIFNVMLPLPRADACEGSFVFAKGALPGSAPTANFSVPGRSEDAMENSFQLLGSLVIEHCNAVAKTISGHFSFAGETHGHGAKIAIADGYFVDVPIDPPAGK